MSNRAVALMRRPAVRRRLRSELAALPHQLVSYEELLAFFIDGGARKALLLMAGDQMASLLEIGTAAQLAAELLPQLTPDDPRLRYVAALMAKYASPESHAPAAAARTRYLTMLSAALDVARQQGSDFYTAYCG